MEQTELPALEAWRRLTGEDGARRAAEAIQAALPEGHAAHLAVLGAVLLTGIALCFRGYRIFRLLVFLLGFALVSAGAAGLAHAELGWEGGALLATALGAGLAGGLLAVLAFYVSVFGLGAACAGALAALGASALGFELGLLPIAVAGALGGALALFVQRPAICLLTAFQGASVIALVSADRLSGGDGLTRLLSDPGSLLAEVGARPGLVVAWAGLALVGAAAQVAGSRREAPAEPPPPASA